MPLLLLSTFSWPSWLIRASWPGSCCCRCRCCIANKLISFIISFRYALRVLIRSYCCVQAPDTKPTQHSALGNLHKGKGLRPGVQKITKPLFCAPQLLIFQLVRCILNRLSSAFSSRQPFLPSFCSAVFFAFCLSS